MTIKKGLLIKRCVAVVIVALLLYLLPVSWAIPLLLLWIICAAIHEEEQRTAGKR